MAGRSFLGRCKGVAVPQISKSTVQASGRDEVSDELVFRMKASCFPAGLRRVRTRLQYRKPRFVTLSVVSELPIIFPALLIPRAMLELHHYWVACALMAH